MSVTEFVLSQLPSPPARLLEVGCGEGALARDLDTAGYEVTAIDPHAPEGGIFRRVTLEEFDESGPFDAVVASRSLHHVADLGDALEKAAALAPLLVLDEFVWDRFDAATAEWYEGQRRVLRAAGREPGGPPAAEWRSKHVDLHGWGAMQAELGRRFEERHFERTPYLYRYLGGEASETLERTLIAAGAIQALGFRYAGVRATTRSAPGAG